MYLRDLVEKKEVYADNKMNSSSSNNNNNNNNSYYVPLTWILQT